MIAAGSSGRDPVDPLLVVVDGLFAVEGRLVGLEPLGGGHIHLTFVGTYETPSGRRVRLVLQRLNTDVFVDPDLLSANVARVAAHLDGREAPRPVPARATEGAPPPGSPTRGAADLGGREAPRPVPAPATMVAVAADGSRWRAWQYVEGRTVPRFENPAQARAAAGAIARLTARLADLPGPPLVEPIAGFHDFARRRVAFETAVASNRVGRAAGCGAEIDRVREAVAVADELAAARATGRLPERLVHNDAKAGNIVFDEAGEVVRAVVDLDTVAPGTVLFDVGDLIRSGAATGPEHGPVDDIGVDVAIAAAVVEGYVAAVPDLLTDGERAALPLAGPLMAFEAAMRFLTDHLAGDVYFSVARPGHNLARARNQLRLVEHLRVRAW